MTTLRPLWVALAALLLIGAPLTAQVDETTSDSQEKQITVVAQEGGCPDEKTFCFDVEERPDDLEPGDEVNLTLRNEGNTSHNAHVTTNDSADPEHRDTPSTAAIANTSTISPGEMDSTNVTVPEDADGIYIWCDMTGHEAAGMWVEMEVGNETGDNATFADGNGSEGNQTFGNDTNESDENASDENESEDNRTFGNDTNESDENASDENESEDNRTFGNDTNESDDNESANESPFGESGGADEPLDEAGNERNEGGQQSTPLGWTLAIGAVVVAMVVTVVVGRR